MTKIETWIVQLLLVMLLFLLSQSTNRDDKEHFNPRQIESNHNNRDKSLKESGQRAYIMDIIFCFSNRSLLEEFKEEIVFNLQSQEHLDFQIQIYSMDLFVDCIKHFNALVKNFDEEEVNNKIESVHHFVQFAFVSERLDELLEIMLKIAGIQNSSSKRNESLWLPSAVIILIIDFEQNQDKSIFKVIDENFSHAEIEIPIDSQIFWTVVSKSSSSFSKLPSWDLWEIYHANSNLVMTKLSNDTEIHEDMFSVLAEILGQTFMMQNISSRRNFHGLPVKVGGVMTDSNKVDINFHQINTTHVEFISGFSVAVMWDLRDSLNFSVIGIWSDHYIWSHELNGIGKLVLEGEVDLSLACHTMFPYRAQKLQFLQPIRPENVKAYFRQPPSYALRNLFTFPFNNLVWTAYSFAWITIMLSLIFLERMSSKVFKLVNAPEDGKQLHHVIFESISISLFQSLPQKDENNSILARKILIITGLLFGVLMFSVYSSVIISALTVQLTPVYDFKHFLQYGYIFLSDQFIQLFYQAISDYPESKKLLEDSSKHFEDYATSFRKVMNDDWSSGSGSDALYSLVLPSHTFYFNAAELNYTQEKVCQLETIPFGPKNGNVAMFLQKGSQLKEFFAAKTALSIERGLRNHHLAQYQRSAEPCSWAKEKSTLSTFKGISTFPQVQLKDSILAFELIGAGGILSLLIFFMERIYELRKRL